MPRSSSTEADAGDTIRNVVRNGTYGTYGPFTFSLEPSLAPPSFFWARARCTQ